MLRWVFLTILCLGVSADAAIPRTDEACADEVVAGRIVPFEMVGSSEAMAGVRALIEKVAPLNTTVLIQGESGTGKELVAAAIHDQSSRRSKPFIAVNVSTIPEALMESQLFGHERGSFTNADKLYKGLFERAHGGTLFLDEFGEMPLGMQAKLLRVLEGHPFTRVGGSTDVRTDVRLVLATNRNLVQMLREKKFREDLFHRIFTFPIVVPPLRERREDIPLLARYFLMHVAPPVCEATKRSPIVGFTEAAEHKLMHQHSWYGNVRELRNAVERAVIFLPANQAAIDADDIAFSDAGLQPDDSPLLSALSALEMGLVAGRATGWGEIETQLLRPYLQAVLKANAGIKKLAAMQLGISLQELNALMRKLGVEDL